MANVSHAVADQLSTLSTPELQAVMRDTATLPLATLINERWTRIDLGHRRVWRDSYWKGSFAKDNVMGWEERLGTPIRRGHPPYAGGRFWKRFDEIRGEEAYGYVINYGIRLVPGRPVVRRVTYPDSRRKFVNAGEEVLLLTYRNPPYRIVYDVIKLVDANHAVGVMHLGRFPRGIEFATFVMARNNYPLEKMAVPDHDALFDDPRLRTPDPSQLAGRWRGYLVLHRQPDDALHNQFNPPLLRCTFGSGAPLEVRLSVGPLSVRRHARFDSDCLRLIGGRSTGEIRQVDPDTLVGRNRTSSGTLRQRVVLTRSGKAVEER